MPYAQTPPQVLYPNIQTNSWVVISRLSEAPVRVVPNLGLLNHSSEFAIPLPTGRIPQKTVDVTLDVQKYDDLGRPLYDDGLGGETTDDVDVDGNPRDPVLVSVTEEMIVNLRDNPEQFTLSETLALAEQDFIDHFSFYNGCKIIIFDSRYDAISIYQEQQRASGFATATHPIFVGPIYGSFAPPADPDETPRGHLMLIAPEIPGVEWYYQIRHGAAGDNALTGPIADIEQASRVGYNGGSEIWRMYPLENFQIVTARVTDSAGNIVSYYWVRTGENGSVQLEQPYPVIPFIAILARDTGGA